MRKQIKTNHVVIAASALFVALCLFLATPHQPQNYTTQCFVSNVSGNNVCLIREDGEAYTFKGKGYTKWQKLNVVFTDNGTSDTSDDEIVEIH